MRICSSTRWLPGPVRALALRFLPRGALILSVLTLGYFIMGQLRNRVLATSFGLGTELDVGMALRNLGCHRGDQGRSSEAKELLARATG